MAQVVKVLFLSVLLLATAAVVYVEWDSTRTEAITRSDELAGYEPKKGVSAQPISGDVLAGIYYRGDGKGYNVRLTLDADGRYEAEWHGCLGVYGEAIGSWALSGREIAFVPEREVDMMRNHLRRVEVLRFRDGWILLPTEKDDRAFYEKWGVSRYSCFQNTNSIFDGP